MLIYGYKGKKCLTSEDFCNNGNQLAIFLYVNLPNFSLSYDEGKIWAKNIYRTYITLCKFNNSLVNTYEVNDSYIKSIEFVKEYLEKNKDIENFNDSRCRNIYDHLKVWYRRLCNNPNCLDDIKWQVVKTMKYYEKQEIFKKASINLKRNYYDFVV